MQYLSEFCVAAVMGTVVVLAMYFLKRNYRTPHNRLFFCMLIVNLLSSALTIASIYTINIPAQYAPFVRNFVNLSYLYLYNLLAGLFMLYADTATKIPRFKNPVRFFNASINVISSSGHMIFKGIPGNPAPLPTSIRNASSCQIFLNYVKN